MKHESVNSPVEDYVARNSRGGHPIPLKSTSYDIEVKSGLAVVKLVRKFRNDEKRPIEATITFPVPFDASVLKIETKVGDRVLTGKAQAKQQARSTYETAIDSGKPAVLHEELLRGLHMLSVANVAPGIEIEVTATFATPLALSEGNGRFRIPVTVGQIYGELPLVESDAILTGGPVEEAAVTAAADGGTVFINGAPAKDKVSVKLDRPIEVNVVGLYNDKPAELVGRAADGKLVRLAFAPQTIKDASLDIDLLLDVSGSMKEYVEDNPEGNRTKWDAVLSGLVAASASVLKASDSVKVWTFANHCQAHGQVKGNGLASFMNSLQYVSGGTELPGAVATVVASCPEANVLLVTDGKSGHPIDVQGAIKTGARFTVVLVGQDALETNVGYLAAMTGGQMFVVAGSDAHHAISAAVASMRNVGMPVLPSDGKPKSILRSVAGTVIEATWSKGGKTAPERDGMAAAVGAFAAHLAIQGMKEAEAAKFAEEEGIVSHLTSIVLVDEAAEAVEGIPATRKVPLASPVTAMSYAAAAPSGSVMRSFAASAASLSVGNAGRASYSKGMVTDQIFYETPMWVSEQLFGGGLSDKLSSETMFPDIHEVTAAPKAKFTDVTLMRGAVDWDADPDALAKGDLDELALWVKAGILALSGNEQVAKLATSLGKTAVTVAVALLAEADSKSSRTAARIARAAFANADKTLLEAARKSVGL